MRLLELFAGTGSVGAAFRAKGWEVISVDIDPKATPTLCMDVRELDVSSLPPIDVVWASPVCTQYSIARTVGPPRDLSAADSLVLATLRIVEQLGCPYFIENPYTGLLKTRPFMQGLVYRIVDYCTYGYPYRKRTAIWTNESWVPSRPLCRHDCSASVGRRHAQSAQRGTRRGQSERSFSIAQLYSIPPSLCAEIAAFASET